MEIKIKGVASYKGHSLSNNGNVNLSFHFRYDELVNIIQLIQMLNNDVYVAVKIPDHPVKKLGFFRIKNINIEDDGESTLKLNSQNDFVEVDNLNSIVTREEFKIQFLSNIELEEKENE